MKCFLHSHFFAMGFWSSCDKIQTLHVFTDFGRFLPQISSSMTQFIVFSMWVSCFILFLEKKPRRMMFPSSCFILIIIILGCIQHSFSSKLTEWVFLPEFHFGDILPVLLWIILMISGRTLHRFKS